MPRQKKQKLKQRKDGRYCCKYKGIQFMAYDPDECLKLREEYKTAEQQGILLSAYSTVADFADRWMPIAHTGITKGTYAGLQIHMDKLKKAIGDKPIATITPLQVKEVYSTYYRDKSKSYITAAKQLYCALFDAAVAENLCRTNPARDKTAAPHKGTEGSHRAITQQERAWIETLCTDHRAHAVAMTMLYAGIRPQEAKALDIDRAVDFKAGTITLTEFAHMDGPYKYKITDAGKTAKARRVIPLLSPLRKTLKGKHGALITNADGSPINKQGWISLWASYKTAMETAINGISKRWYGRTAEQKKLQEAGKLPAWVEFNVVPYDLRHSFCAMICRDNGVEINTCIQWMGHKDARMILKIYDEVSDNRNKSEAKKLEKILKKAPIRMQNGMQKQKMT